MEKTSIDGRIIPTINGGHGSGNFGHSGRPGKVGGSGKGEGDSPKSFSMDSPEVTAIEEAGWRVDDLDDDQIQIGTMSDMGEDFFFYADKENLAESIQHYAEEFDPEEHASLFLDSAGDVRQDIGGIPTNDPDDLRRDAESIKEMLGELATKVRLASTPEGRDAEAKKAKAEREEHIKQIDKIIGKEKISEGKTKAEDDKNYKKLEKDITAIKRILAKEKSRENFGQEEIRKLKDKYSDYMSGNWSVVGRFTSLIRDLEDWADNYQNW